MRHKFQWTLFNNNYISIPEKVKNLYISYTLVPELRNLNTDFTLGNCLFGSVTLICVQDFHYLMEAMEKNVIIFGADMSSSLHVNH